MALDKINQEANLQVKQLSHNVCISGMMGTGQNWGKDCRLLKTRPTAFNFPDV